MTFLSRPVSMRLQLTGGHVLIHVSARACAQEYVLVASCTRPLLRRFTVYRSPAFQPAPPPGGIAA